MIRNVRIVKGGRLLVDIYDIDNDHVVKGSDQTKRLTCFFNYECSVDNNVTFGDLLRLMQSYDNIEELSMALTSNSAYLTHIIAEGFSDKPENEDIKKIIVGWRGELNDYDNDNELEIYTNIIGKKDNDYENYCLSLCPINEIVNAKIEINNKLELIDWREDAIKQNREKMKNVPIEQRKLPVFLKAQKIMTLYDILSGLFWELTFHGVGENKKNVLSELNERIDEIKRDK